MIAMPEYIVPTGFSTLVFGAINILKWFSELLKKISFALASINKGFQTQVEVENKVREK